MPVERHSPLYADREGMGLWFGLLTGPVAWLIQFQTIYTLAPLVCGGMSPAVLHATAAAGLLAAAGGAWVAWRAWRRGQRQAPSDTDPPEVTPKRFLPVLGVMTGALFALATAAQWLSVLLLPPCPE